MSLPEFPVCQPDAFAIRREIERIAASGPFRRAPRLVEFLRFVVEETLAGRGEELKEYRVGVSVYRRPADFDPATDSVVRVEARRLRAALDRYETEASGRITISIRIPKGGYVPEFQIVARDTATPVARTIAVLPFTDVSGDGALAPFCQGLEEEIRAALCRCSGVQVLAPQLMGQDLERAHRVERLIQGSVREEEGRLRITVYCAESESGIATWSLRFDVEMAHPLRVQEEVARAVALAAAPASSHPPAAAPTVRRARLCRAAVR